jgi:hypothetical protein
MAHSQDLHQRGLNDTEIARRSYRSLSLGGRAALARRVVHRFGTGVCMQVPGFFVNEQNGRRWWSLAGAAGLLIPVRNLAGHIVALKVRADAPSESLRYTMISSAKHGGPSPGAQVHIPLHDGQYSDLIRLTEGERKADVATVLSGVLTVAIPGVSVWRKALPVLQALQARRVLLAFDADWRSNPHVAQALGQAAFALVRAGIDVQIEDWDPAIGKGIDDVLAAGHTPMIQPVALAFGAAVRGRTRSWKGQIRTIAAEEFPAWY